jgi:2-alkenal reductase
MNHQVSFSYKTLTIGLVALLLVALLGTFVGGVFLSPHLNGIAQAAQTSPGDADVVAAYERALSDLYNTVAPSVVSIRVTQSVEGRSQLPTPFEFGRPDLPPQPDEEGQIPPRQGQGSGFVWDTEGHIITNYHVVADATKVEVVFANGRTVEAEVLGTDPNSDLAVIKVNLPASELQPVTLGDSDNLKVGQLAIAIGSPFGQEFTMTSGIVSAVHRTIRSGNTFFSIPEAIQTDAPINPGNSGGPLLDRQGAVIGINTQILSLSGVNGGVGFAVPINTAKQIVPTLIKGEDYEYAWLGITGATLTSEVVESMKLPTDLQGALIINVSQDGPADKAGLVGSDKTLTVEGIDYQLGGDVITAINSQPIKGIDELIAYLNQETRPGDTVKLDVVHADGSQETINVTLGARPSFEELMQQEKENAKD